MNKIYLDTQIYIYALEDNPIFRKKIKSIIKKIEDNNEVIVVSPLILTELLAKPYKIADLENIKNIKSALLSLSNLEIKNMNVKIAEKASELRGVLNLRTPDAVHFATALDRKCKTFYTNDAHFKNLKLENIKIKTLS